MPQDPIYLDLEYPSRPLTQEKVDFLAARKAGIGGSDIAGILGLSNWKSPLEIYFDKTEEREVEDKDNEFMFWGTTLEDAVAREAARRLDIEVHQVKSVIKHPDRPWHLANIDRRVVNTSIGERIRSLLPPDLASKEDLRIGMECKTTSAWMKSDWLEDGIPPVYGCQCQWYLDATGWDAWIMACLFGGNDLRLWIVLPDPDAIVAMREAGAEFWRRVQEKDPPEPGPTEPDGILLAKMYPHQSPGKEVPYTEEIERWRRLYLEAGEAIKKWDEDKSNAKHHLQHIIGDGEVVMMPDGSKITWKNNKSKEVKEVDVQALEREQPLIAERFTVTRTVQGPRVMRVGKPKKSK